ncbi:MAG: hypothetical protein IJM34_07100 [Lachnospiraceae bacterium]|nr:hypothetical protein [Lachnospiraceae bacterium]
MKYLIDFFKDKYKISSFALFLAIFLISYTLSSFTLPIMASGDDVTFPDFIINDDDEDNTLLWELYRYCARFFDEIDCTYSASDLTYAIGKWYDYAQIYTPDTCPALSDHANSSVLKAFITWCQNMGFFITNSNKDLRFTIKTPYPKGYHKIDDIWKYWNYDGEEDGSSFTPSEHSTSHHGTLTQFPFIDEQNHFENQLNNSVYFARNFSDTQGHAFLQTYGRSAADTTMCSTTGLANFTNGSSFSGRVFETAYSPIDNDNPINIIINHAGTDTALTNEVYLFGEGNLVSQNLAIHISNGIASNIVGMGSMYPWFDNIYNTYIKDNTYKYYSTSISNKNAYDSEQFLNKPYNNYFYFTNPIEKTYDTFGLTYDFIWGNTLIISGTHSWLFWDGSWYDLGENSDPLGTGYHFRPAPDKDLDQIIIGVFNQYNYYTVSGNSSDYSFDLKTIIDILQDIDNNLNKFSDDFFDYAESVLKKLDIINESIQAIECGDTIFNNTYNYFFTLNEEQENDINNRLGAIKLPFSGILGTFSGVSAFLNDIHHHAEQYSSGSGYGSAGDVNGDFLFKSDLGVSANTPSGNSVSYGNYVSVPLYDIKYVESDIPGPFPEDPPEIVGGGGARIGDIVAPSIKMDLSEAHSDINYGGEVKVLDLQWYVPYKPTVDKIIVCLCWALFIWHSFKTLPSLINGTNGIVNGKEI